MLLCEAVFTATASDCVTCCDTPLDPIIKLTPCNGKAPTYETLSSNITSWDAGYLDNPCIFLDVVDDATGLEGSCYRASIGTVDSGVLIEIQNAETQAEPCSCDCCQYQCSFTIDPCPGEVPPSFDPIVGSVVSPSVVADPCQYSTGDVVNISDSLGKQNWCFVLSKVCAAPNYILNFTPVVDCDDPACGEIPPPSGLRYKMCSDDTETWFYQDPIDPIPAPFSTPGLHYIGDLAGIDCVKKNCCITVELTEEIGETLGFTTYVSLMECDPLNNSTALNCDCCRFYDVARYEACDEKSCALEGYPILNIDVCDWGKTIGENWKPGTAPNIIKVDIGGEFECCYQYVEPACVAEDFISVAEKAYEDLSYDPAITTCEACEERFFKYTLCNDPGTELITSTVENPGIEDLPLPFVGMVEDATKCENGPECCVTILEEVPSPEGPLVKIECWATATDPYATGDCDCCLYKDNIIYSKCEGIECGIALSDVIIDACKEFDITQASGSLPPEFVYIEYSGITCCYQRGSWECLPTTTPAPTSVVDSATSDCAECFESLQNFKITNCADPLDVTITDDDLSANVIKIRSVIVVFIEI